MGGEQRGCDGGKKIRGRKRHLLVPTNNTLVCSSTESTSPKGGFNDCRQFLSTQNCEGLVGSGKRHTQENHLPESAGVGKLLMIR